MALTADHGEEVLDHGGRYHPPSRLTEELIRVPLLLRAPGLTQAGAVAAPFSLMHRAPTLLDLADAPDSDDRAQKDFQATLQVAQRG
jgi:arylsulfatase A-like enzyme